MPNSPTNLAENACGRCAAFPCFRTGSSELLTALQTAELTPSARQNIINGARAEMTDSGAMCFQQIRECRQECDHYIPQKLGNHTFPANGGTCRLTGKKVNYEAMCTVEEMKYQAPKTKQILTV